MRGLAISLFIIIFAIPLWSPKICLAGEQPSAGPLRIAPDPERVEEMGFARVGDPYAFALIASGGHGYGYVWDHGVFPVGFIMSIDADDDGVVYIEGVPAEAGSCRIKAVVSDAAEPSMTAEFVYTLNIAPHAQ